MGEAKRRRVAEQEMEREQTDPATGQTYQVRAAGITPRQLLDQWRRVVTGQTDAVDVPCKGCQQCCWWPRVEVELEQETAEDLAYLALVEDDRGWHLRKREDGACIHLGASGCTVRDHRPRACRRYDCRVFSLIASVQSIDEEGKHCAPMWIFRLNDIEDKAIMMAAHMGMLPHIAAMLKGDAPPSYEVVLRAIYTGIAEHLPKARQFVTELLRLPASELAKIIEAGPQATEYIRRAALAARGRHPSA